MRVPSLRALALLLFAATALGALWSVAPALAAVSEVAEETPSAASAVERHERELAPPVTIWCLANPKQVVGAARAFGFDVGQVDGRNEFEYHGKAASLPSWARSGNRDRAREFEQACRNAFIAFSHAGISLALFGLTSAELREALADGSDSDEGLTGLGGVLVGALLTGIGGLATYRRRGHRDDANELRRLDLDFLEAVGHYVAEPEAANVEASLLVSARLLRDTVGEWTPQGRYVELAPWRVSQDEVEAVRSKLKVFLDREASGFTDVKSEEPDKRAQAETDLLGAAEEIHASVAEIADQVAKFRRPGDRQPPA